MNPLIEKHGAFRLNRLFSRPLSALLVRTPVTPNQITLLSLAFGLTAGFLFSLGSYRSCLGGAFFYQLAIVLDNCDGEIARAKNMRSRLGAWLDIVADFFTDVSLFVGIGLGLLAKSQGEPVLLWMGLCLSGGLLHLALVVWEKLHGFGPAVFESPNATPNQKRNWALDVLDAFREGESSWFVVILCVVGKADWILWFGGVYMQILWLSGLLLNVRWWIGRRHPR